MSQKYLRCYYNIINRAFLEKRKKGEVYYEKHHIKPRSLYKKSKLVLLTPREHYIVHFLLYKHFQRNGNTNQKIKMACAWRMMTIKEGSNTRYISKTYELAKIAFSKNMKGENSPNYKMKHTDETKKKISKSLNNRPEEDKAETRTKQRKAKLGIKLSTETIAKMSESRTGHDVSIETREKLRAQSTGRKLSADVREDMSIKKKLLHASEDYISHSAKTIGIFNTEDELVYVSYKSLRKFCEKHNLPSGAFSDSLQNNRTLYQNSRPSDITKLTKSGNIKFKGWYAKELSKETI